MNILLTGAAGFIGSHLADYLLSRGARVVAVDNFATGREENIREARASENFVFYEADVNNRVEVEKIFGSRRFDTVFHFAAQTGVIRTQEDPLSVLEDLNGIRNILELSAASGVGRVVFSSSSEVYGDPAEVPIAEDGVICPGLTYAAVKFMGEKFLEGYYRARGLNYSCLRFFNVYGPRQNSSPYGFVVGIFIEQALTGKPLTIFGDGSATRDFTYVDDAVRGALLAAESGSANTEIINIGTGVRTSIKELAEKIIKATGSDSLPEYLPPRENDIMHRLADITKMDKILRHTPAVDLEEGLTFTAEWYRDRLKKEVQQSVY